MTKKQKHRRDVFSADSNVGGDDFILVDLDVKPDQEELSPVPLNHVVDDEETIDRLLIHSGFEANDELEILGNEPDSQMIVDMNPADDFSDFDQFGFEAVEHQEQNRRIEAEETPVSDFSPRVDYDEIPDEQDAIDRLLVDAGFDVNDEQKEADKEPDVMFIDDIDLADDFSDFDQSGFESVEPEELPVSAVYSRVDLDKILIHANDEWKEDAGSPNEFGVNSKEQKAMKTDKSIFDSEEIGFALETGPINDSLVREQSQEAVRQEPAVSETINQEVALSSLNNDTEITNPSSFSSDLEAIKKHINGYEDKVKKAAVMTYVSFGFGIIALLSTVVLGIMVSRAQTKVSKLTDLVSIIEEDLSGVVEKNSGLDINGGDPSGASNQNVNELTEHFSELESPGTATTAGKVSAEKTIELQKHGSVYSPSLIEKSKSNTAGTAAKQASINKLIDKQQDNGLGLEKKKLSNTANNITSVNKKTISTKAASGWSVNLTAYNQLSEAKRKAALFIQKGIPVEVITVDMNNTKWYRLKVGGFKNKEKADAYAAKIKKSLNLEVVFVGNP